MSKESLTGSPHMILRSMLIDELSRWAITSIKTLDGLDLSIDTLADFLAEALLREKSTSVTTVVTTRKRPRPEALTERKVRP